MNDKEVIELLRYIAILREENKWLKRLLKIKVNSRNNIKRGENEH